MKKIFVLLLCLGVLTLGASPRFAPQPRSPRSVKLEKRTIPLVRGGKVQFQLYVPLKAAPEIRRNAADSCALPAKGRPAGAPLRRQRVCR